MIWNDYKKKNDKKIEEIKKKIEENENNVKELENKTIIQEIILQNKENNYK